jgi:hypothetical protein
MEQREIGRKAEENLFRPLLERYRAALGQLATWGIRISPHSRLRRYEQRLAGVGDDPSQPVDAELMSSLMFDLREIDEITEIVESFSTPPTDAESKKLRLVATGAEHPDDEVQSAARDGQYELFLRSVFIRSPVEVTAGEPDLMVKWRSREIPVEAKRPKSIDRLDDNLRKAVEQLDRHEEHGIVAISFDQALRPAHHHLSVSRREQMTAMPNDLLEAVVTQRAHAMANRVRHRNVAALLFTLRIPSQVASTGQLSLATGFHLEALVPESHPGYTAFEMLEDVITRASQ